MSEDLDSNNKIKLSSIVSAFRNLATSFSDKVDEVCNTDITFALTKIGDDIENLIEQLNNKDQTLCTESLYQNFTQIKALSQNLDVKVDCKKLISDTEVSFISNGLKEFLRVKSIELDSELSDVFKDFVLKYIQVYEVIYGHFSKEFSSENKDEDFSTSTLNWMESSLSIIAQNIHSIILDCYQILESEDWVKYKNTDIFLQIQRRKKYIFHIFELACNKKELKECNNKPKGFVENSDQIKHFFSDISSSEDSCETFSSESKSSSESCWQTISSYKTLKSHNTSMQGLRKDNSVSSTSLDDSENKTSGTSTNSSDSTHFQALTSNLNPKVVETNVNQDNKTQEHGKEYVFISENDRTNESELNSSTNDLKAHKAQFDALYSEISSVSSISTVNCCFELEQDESSSNTKLTDLPLVKPLTTPMMGAGVKSEDIVSIPIVSDEKKSEVELASSATSIDCEQDCCPFSQLAEIGFPCMFWNPLIMEQIKKRKDVCNSIQVIKSGEEPEGFQHIDPDFKGTTVIFKLCEDLNEKKDYKEAYQEALQETRKSKQQLIDALESSISKETKQPSVEVEKKKLKYNESLKKLNGASKKHHNSITKLNGASEKHHKSITKEHPEFETPLEIESRYKLANEGQKINTNVDVLTKKELRTYNCLLKMTERVEQVNENLPLEEFRKLKCVIAEEEEEEEEEKKNEIPSEKVAEFDELKFDDSENNMKKTKKIKKCCKLFFSKFCSKKFLTLNDRPGATAYMLTREFLEEQQRKNTKVLVNKEEPKKLIKDKKISITNSLASEESIENCLFPGCCGQKDFRQVLGHSQFKKLYSVLSLINLKNISQLLPENLYNVVQDCNLSVNDFNEVTAELVVETWKNQLKERKVGLEEALYSIYYPLCYVDYCEQKDFIKLQNVIESWLSNTKKNCGEEIIPMKKSKKYTKDAAFIEEIVNRGDFMKTYQSTVRKFRNNPDFKDFQDSPYAPPKAENEMKQVFKDISAVGRVVTKHKYLHKKSQELKNIVQANVKSSTAPTIRTGCVDLGQLYKTESKSSKKRIQHNLMTGNRFNSTTNSPIASSIISRSRSGSSVLSSRNEAYKQSLYNPSQIIRHARQEVQPFRTELKRPIRPRKLKSLPLSASIKSEFQEFSDYNDKIPRSLQVSKEEFLKVKLTCGTEYMRRRPLKLKRLTNKKVKFDMTVE